VDTLNTISSELMKISQELGVEKTSMFSKRDYLLRKYGRLMSLIVNVPLGQIKDSSEDFTIDFRGNSHALIILDDMYRTIDDIERDFAELSKYASKLRGIIEGVENE